MRQQTPCKRTRWFHFGSPGRPGFDPGFPWFHPGRHWFDPGSLLGPLAWPAAGLVPLARSWVSFAGNDGRLGFRWFETGQSIRMVLMACISGAGSCATQLHLANPGSIRFSAPTPGLDLVKCQSGWKLNRLVCPGLSANRSQLTLITHVRTFEDPWANL